jgi:hypothetical protein
MNEKLKKLYEIPLDELSKQTGLNKLYKTCLKDFSEHTRLKLIIHIQETMNVNFEEAKEIYNCWINRDYVAINSLSHYSALRIM